ncbi:MAG TPA: DNA primase [Kofleriaceae bacterium]|nr:DNA primase [Kofleriaceae bacterium]
MIPDEVIDEIRTRADIVAVIGQHVQLRRAGRSWKGLCPFHGEKSPSFNVSPDKGFFYCFGCHKKGDVFTFVMEYEGKSFHEAIEQLAAQTGVALPEVQESPQAKAARGERTRMLELNKLATQFFRETLAHPDRGRLGRAYLEKRGVGDAVRDKFQLGYAPQDWHALADFLKAKRADMKLAVALGLVAPQPRAGGFYDRYRDRLVCPVVVPGGEVSGFSARVVGEEKGKDGQPPRVSGSGADAAAAYAPAKYINSPESSVYKKSKLLFGLAQAREAFGRKKRAVLVEGNFDVITLHQAGFDEVIAPLGTSLTSEQVELLRRLADEVVVCYDGDRAGRTATRAALELLVMAEVPVRIVAMPDGEDPDSFVRNRGAEALAELIQRAQGGVEYFAFEVWGRAKSSADARARALEDAVRLLAKVANPTKRDLITGTLATAMELDEGVVRRALARASGEKRERPGAPSHPNAPGARTEEDREGGRAIAQPSGTTPVPPPPTHELELIALLADHPALQATAEQLGVFSLLTDGRLRDMYSAARTGRRLVELAPVSLPPSSAELVLSAKYAAETDPSRCLEQMALHLRARGQSVGLVLLKQRLAEAQRAGDRELARRLANEIVSTRKQVD